MKDIKESKLKAEIDEIVDRIDSILKKVDELSPAKEQDTPTENNIS